MSSLIAAPTRRRLLLSVGLLPLAAPAIVRASSLMAVVPPPVPHPDRLVTRWIVVFDAQWQDILDLDQLRAGQFRAVALATLQCYPGALA